MSQSASQATKFYQEAVEKSEVWTVKDENGFPAPMNGDGKRVMPFWSSKTRVLTIIETVAAYKAFEPFSMSIEDFISKWIPGLKKDGLLVGVNWSGIKAVGYDLKPDDLLIALKNQMEN